MMEYTDLTERFADIEETVQESLDSAIESSVRSEEFFSSSYQEAITSYASVGDGSKATTDISTLCWIESEKAFRHLNTYSLAMFYKNNGHLPKDSSSVATCESYLNGSAMGGVAKVYDFLYGEPASDYNNSSLLWANRNTSRREEYNNASSLGIETSRSNSAMSYNSNFKEYYDNIGKLQETTAYLKEHEGGTDTYKLRAKTFPLLANMGFAWMHSYNRVDSDYTNDNLTSTAHIGKSRLGHKRTIYFLTPASLGVTYIPVEVLKPTFLATLDSMTRLNKLGGVNQATSTDAQVTDTLASASNCITPKVHHSAYGAISGSDGSTGTLGATITQNKTHAKSSSDEDIVTDGLIEFDKSTAKVKVDYFYLDFGNSSIRNSAEKIISRLNGCVQTYDNMYNESTGRQKTLDLFLNEDSGTSVNNITSWGSFASSYGNTKNGRIVARVSVKIKVHVPYQSAVMQWMCERTGTHHYDIKLWNASSNRVDLSSDGIWYKYTTYYCTSRS